MDRMLARDPAEIAADFARDGFVIARGLFTSEECRTWKAEAQRILTESTAEAEAKGEPRPRFWRTGVYVGLSIASDVFRRMNRDPRLLDLLESIIGPNLQFWSDKVVFKGESADYGTPWHQDWP
jgi:phytanoyl-CoA hydroxylase